MWGRAVLAVMVAGVAESLLQPRERAGRGRAGPDRYRRRRLQDTVRRSLGLSDRYPAVQLYCVEPGCRVVVEPDFLVPDLPVRRAGQVSPPRILCLYVLVVSGHWSGYLMLVSGLFCIMQKITM